MAGPGAAVLLAVLLLAPAASLAQQQDAGSSSSEQELLTEATVDAYALVQVPGCDIGKPNSLQLVPGVLDGQCVVRMPHLAPNDPAAFTFEVAPPGPGGAEMSAAFVLSVQGGTASMSLWLPGSPINGPPDMNQHELFSSPASSEGWISLPGELLATRPGRYILSVTAFSGQPRVVLHVTTLPRVLQLEEGQRKALAALAQSCCQNVYSNSSSQLFCNVIAPAALQRHDEASWQTDLCHLAPNSCNAAGQLTRLILPGVGLTCPSFPQQLSQLTALRRLDLSANNFAGVSLKDVASTLAPLTQLEELSLGSTGLTGQLSCDLAAPALPNMQVLDVSMNLLDGPLPGCLVNSLKQLYVAGDSLSGTLPAFKASSKLRTLYANQQRGAGFTGPIPTTLAAASALRHINLGGNSLTGTLPPLPRGLKLLNVSSNQLSGALGALPSDIWHADVSGNALSGRLPALVAYSALESFVANGNTFTNGLPALPPALATLECAGCGLSGALPRLQPSLRRVDLSDNNLVGDAGELDLRNVHALRLANNSLTGSVPATAAKAPRLLMLDLSSNKLQGRLPEDWESPALQMLLLEDNKLTGSVPASLAALHNLGVLRLASNHLSGDLTAFAAALPDPQQAFARNRSDAVSRLFEFNVSGNGLVGPVPDGLGNLGFFNPEFTVLVPGPDGSPSLAPRVLDLSSNKLDGPWPLWLLKDLPAVASGCNCALAVNVSGADARLYCPPSSYNVSDFGWQLASRLRYTCWDGTANRTAWLLDYLVSSANGLDKIDTTSTARGDGSTAPAAIAAAEAAAAGRKRAAAIAGGVVGGVGAAVLLGALAWLLAGRRALATHKATSFNKFEDDAAAAAAAPAAAAAGTAGGGGAAAAGGARHEAAGAAGSGARDAASSATM